MAAVVEPPSANAAAQNLKRPPSPPIPIPGNLAAQFQSVSQAASVVESAVANIAAVPAAGASWLDRGIAALLIRTLEEQKNQREHKEKDDDVSHPLGRLVDAAQDLVDLLVDTTGQLSPFSGELKQLQALIKDLQGDEVDFIEIRGLKYCKEHIEHECEACFAGSGSSPTTLPADDNLGVDVDLLRSKREGGNAAFKEQRYDDAFVLYSDAIAYCSDLGGSISNSELSKLYCNRAATCLKLEKYDLAYSDADHSVVLDPKYSKAHWRRVLALEHLDRKDEALMALHAFLELQPKSAAGLAKLKVLQPPPPPQEVGKGTVKKRKRKKKKKKKVVAGTDSQTGAPTNGSAPAKKISDCWGCGKNASRICSKCKKAAYCGRECQKVHWPQHKDACAVFVKSSGQTRA